MRAQRFDVDANPVGGEFLVNTYTSNEQRDAEVTALEDGGYVITWHSRYQDGSDWGIYGQVFDVAGSKVGNEFRANTHTSHDQTWPSVAAQDGGGFVISWQSRYQDYSSTYGIYAQREWYAELCLYPWGW